MNMTLFRCLWLNIFVFSITLLYSQNNYRPGFVITLQKDTVYGEIDFRTDKMNAKRCVFRSRDDAAAKTYHPFEIVGYRFTDDGKYYVSKNIELQYGVPQPVFLEYLLQGLKSLYYYETEEDVPVYFIEDNNQLVKIDAPKLSKQTASLQYKDQTDRYIPLLHYAFKDYPDLGPKIDRARFNRKDLIKLTKEYHYAICTSNEDCVEFEAKENKRSVQLTVTPYVGIIQYMVPSDGAAGLSRNPDLSYLAGVTLAISNKRWMSSLSGCLDVSYSQVSASESVHYESKDTYETIKHSGGMLSAKLGVRYTYPKGMIRPFAEAGLDISTMLSAKVETKDKRELWVDGIFPGYYVNAGLNFRFSRKKSQMISVRAQFKSIRDMMEKSHLMSGWSGVIGYTF